jgi:ABC-2 type transport system permease protein
VRAVASAAVLTVKQLLRARFYLLLGVVQPLFFILVTSALAGGAQSVGAPAVAGCAVMGMWSLVLFGAGRALLRERNFGTVQFLLVTPHGLLRPVLGICVGAALLGAMPAATAVAGGALLGFELNPASVALFVALVPVVMAGLAAQGLLLCALFVLSRQANAFSNAMEYPVWFACGLLVPLADRPWWAAVAGALLTPTYAGQAFRTALGGAGVSWSSVAAVAGLAAVQVLVAVPLFRVIERRVRQKGDVSFA